MKNKYYSKSYKEKTNPFPHESGRKERPKIDAPLAARDEIKEYENINYTPYTPKNEIESVWGDLASDAEKEIYTTIDFSLGNTEDISPALLEALKYYQKDEEQNQIEESHRLTKNNRFQDKEINQYEEYNENFDKQQNIDKNIYIEEKYAYLEEEFNNKPLRINKKSKEISGDYYGGIKEAKMRKNTKNRNAKSKTKFKRIHKTDKKNSQKEIEKYGFAA